ncbi:dynamin family protein [Paenibacillus sp. GCM10023250]|uniref:dynamin family protein n=1 Tax=Paenibacillus sp. GCM10023250 TaxID=3252648 RepID=UPI0036181D6A
MEHTTLYANELNQLEELAAKYGISEHVQQKIAQCRKDITEFSLKVLVIGGFSAGKSALLNTLLNRDLLVEDQGPETAIASELIYDEREYVELVGGLNGNVRCSVDEISHLDSNSYQHLTYHIQHDFLKKYKSYTLVDMPGLNSGLEQHNKAIMQYIGQGNAYILVVDCEDGEIKSSSIDFLREIKQYDNNLSIVVTKSDKKPESQVAAIVNKVKQTASAIFQKDVVVVSTSKFDNIEVEMEKILGSFHIKDLCEQAFKPHIVEIANLCMAAIEKIAQSYEFDDQELVEKIKMHQKTREQLVSRMEKERKKLSLKMKNQVKPAIVADVQNALYSNSSALASSITSGDNAFTRTVNDLLRPVLISSTQRYTEASFHEFVQQIDLKEIFEDHSENIAADIAGKYTAVTSSLQKILETTDKSKGLYRLLTGVLAITTTVVAPWLELIIIFLPDIMRFFGQLSQKSQQEDLKRKVETEIIPQIVSKLSQEMDHTLVELESELMDEMEEKMNEMIEVETEALQASLTMKQAKESAYAAMQNETAQDIRQVQSLIQAL